MKKITDKQELLDMIEENPSAIENASDELKNDFDEMIDLAETIYQNGGSFFEVLKHMGDKLKNDSDKMLSLYEQEGNGALQCFGGNLKNDKTFMLNIIKDMDNKGELDDSSTVTYVAKNIGEKLKKDKEVMLMLISHYGLALQYADDTLKKDEDVALAAISDTPVAIEYIDKGLINDKNFISKTKNNEGFREYIESWREQRRNELLEQQLEEKNRMR